MRAAAVGVARSSASRCLPDLAIAGVRVGAATKGSPADINHYFQPDALREGMLAMVNPPLIAPLVRLIDSRLTEN